MTSWTRPAATNVILGVLFGGAFVMGCAEMLVVGLLDLIATDQSVSVSAAGALVTANALGLAIGGPVLTFLTTTYDRRQVLLGATGVFVAANLLPALGADYSVFLAARVVIGAVQGLFIAAAITMATGIVPADRAGRAMSVVISGFATASALGLPLGTLLGQAVGWRGAFIAVVAGAGLVLAAAAVVLPSVPTAAEGTALGQARHAFAPRVLAVLGLCVVIFTAVQSAVTYLVPFLDEVSGVDGSVVGLFLLAYGVATTVGSSAGGRFADLDAARTLVVGTLGVTVFLVAMHTWGGKPVVVGITVVGLGLFAMGMAPSMQHRVVSLAGAGAPLASSLPASAVNVGIALGSYAGGVAIDAQGPLTAVVTGAVVAVIAVVVAWATSGLRPTNPATSPTAALTASAPGQDGRWSA